MAKMPDDATKKEVFEKMKSLNIYQVTNALKEKVWIWESHPDVTKNIARRGWAMKTPWSFV